MKNTLFAVLFSITPTLALAGYVIEMPETKVKILDSAGKPVPGMSVVVTVVADNYGVRVQAPNPFPIPGWTRHTQKTEEFRTNASGEVTIPANTYSSHSPAKRDPSIDLRVGELIECKKQGWLTFKEVQGTINMPDGKLFQSCTLMKTPELDQIKRLQGKMVCRSSDDLATIKQLQMEAAQDRQRCF